MGCSNLDNSPTDLFRKIYDSLYHKSKGSSIPQASLFGEYQYKAAHVADQEINMAACIVRTYVIL